MKEIPPTSWLIKHIPDLYWHCPSVAVEHPVAEFLLLRPQQHPCETGHGYPCIVGWQPGNMAGGQDSSPFRILPRLVLGKDSLNDTFFGHLYLASFPWHMAITSSSLKRAPGRISTKA